MNKYTYTKKLNITDVGFDGSTAINNVMDLFQQAVTLHTEIMGVDTPSINEKYNAKWFIVSAHFEFNKMPRIYDDITVHTWPLPASAIKFPRAFVLENDKGETLATCMTQWCTVDRDSGEFVRASVIKMPFDEYITDDPTTERGRVPNTPCDTLCYERKMLTSDIDMNNHVNNVAYIRMAMDCFSTKELSAMDIKSFDISFKNQCFEGDTVSFYKQTTEDGWLIEAKIEDKTIFKAKITG